MELSLLCLKESGGHGALESRWGKEKSGHPASPFRSSCLHEWHCPFQLQREEKHPKREHMTLTTL